MVAKAAIAMIGNDHCPINRVYKEKNWFAKTVPLSENISPLPYITKAPNPRKTSANITVPIYPILKSSNVSFINSENTPN